MIAVTVSGSRFTAELSRDPSQNRTAVSIYEDNRFAGNGYLNEHCAIVDCPADLGEEVYDALDEAIQQAFARGEGAEFDPTAR